MRLRALLLAASLVPAAILSIAAVDTESCRTLNDAGTPTDTADDTLACTSASYLSCDSALDTGVTGKLQDPLVNVPLTFDKPATSFTAGAGCGEAEAAHVSGTAMTNIYDLNVAGFLDGNVDTITFELHSIYAGSQRAGGTMNLDVRFDVGGVSPNGTVDNVASGTGTVTKTPKPIRFAVDPATSSTGASESFTFTLTDIYTKFPQLSTLGTGSGNFQQLNLTVSMVQPDYAGAYVWGASEVPASITLNAPADKLGKVISATSLVG